MQKLYRCNLKSPAKCEHWRWVNCHLLCGYLLESCTYRGLIPGDKIIEGIKDTCVCVDMNNDERIQEIQRIITTYEKESA